MSHVQPTDCGLHVILVAIIGHFHWDAVGATLGLHRNITTPEPKVYLLHEFRCMHNEVLVA